MAPRIYHVTDEGELDVMEEQLYESEDILQELLENHPDLLAGDRSDDSSTRWLLVGREVAVPDQVGTEWRWSLDHLFLDQDAIPTLVEVKRSTDTRIRREVVGQLLEYAANAVSDWPVERVQATFEAHCEARGATSEEVISETLGIPAEQVPDFWDRFATNLALGKVRLVFVADQIPSELLHIVEFLNGQMNPAEIYAVEVKQFVGSGQRTLVPRIVGRTAVAERSKASGPRKTRQWDEGSFFDELAIDRDAREVEVARRLHEWGDARFPKIKWGVGFSSGSFYPLFGPTIFDSCLFGVLTTGVLSIGFVPLAEQPPFKSEELRSEYLRRLNAILPHPLPDDELLKWPSVKLADLVESDCLDRLLEVFQWAYDQIRERSDGG